MTPIDTEFFGCEDNNVGARATRAFRKTDLGEDVRYTVYRSVDGGPAEVIASVLAITQFSDNTIQPGTLYTYAVSAVPHPASERDIEELQESYWRRRNFLHASFTGMGLKCQNMEDLKVAVTHIERYFDGLRQGGRLAAPGIGAWPVS